MCGWGIRIVVNGGSGRPERSARLAAPSVRPRRSSGSGSGPIVCALFVVVLAGCTGVGSSNEREDAGPDDDAGNGSGPSPVAPPAPPVLTPCPAGWRELPDPEVPDLAVCEPWPEGGHRDDCADDEAHFPGRPGCERIGTACPAGDWAEDIPKDATVVYVREGADPDVADGTRDLPYPTVQAGIDASQDGDVVAISKGTFDEVVTVRRRVTLWGACVAQTLLTSSVRSDEPIVDLRGGGAALRNFRVSGPRPGIRVLNAPMAVEIESVAVLETRGSAGPDGGGIVVRGDLVAREIVVRDSLVGLNVVFGGRARIERASFERSQGQGIVVGGAMAGTGELFATDVVVHEAGFTGLHLGVALVEVTRGVFEGNRNDGVRLDGNGVPTRITATDLVVRDTGPYEGSSGAGLVAFEQSTVVLDRALFEANGVGLYMQRPGSSLHATDLVIRDSRSGIDAPGTGLVLRSGATARVVRCEILRATAAALHTGVDLAWPDDEVSSLEAEDLAIRRTGPEPGAGDFGLGMQLHAANATLRRTLVQDNHWVGLLVVEGTEVEASDLVIERTLETETGPYGYGVAVEGGAAFEATRFRFADNAGCGIGVRGEADLHDGIVSGNAAGACVDRKEYDLARLQDRVVYRDNEVNLDATVLPLPDPYSF